MLRHQKTFASLTLAAAVITLAACQSSNGIQAPATDANGTQKQSLASDPKAAELALQTPSAGVKANQFELRDDQGRPLAGAKILVNGEELTANDKGVIDLPEGLVTAGTPFKALIKADGYVKKNVEILPGYAIALSPIDAKVSTVDPASGGIITNAAGNMEVSFGPGSLDKPAQVHVTRTYQENPTSLKAVSAGLSTFEVGESLGLYSYQLELGDAKIQPGASISVRFKVEGTMNEYIKTMGADFEKTPFAKEFSQDGSGQYWFTMKVPTPPAPGAATDEAAVGGAAAQRKLLAASCSTGTDTETYWYQQWYQRVANGGRGGADRGCRDVPGGVAVHDWAINDGHCYYQSGTTCAQFRVWDSYWAQGTRQHPYSTINAYVHYSADSDERIRSQAIPGAQVYFGHGSNGFKSGGWAGTGSDGYASRLGPSNWGGTASSYTNIVGAINAAASYLVDCRTVDLSIVKRRPVVSLNLTTTGTALPGTQSLKTTHGLLPANGLTGATASPAIGLNNAGETFNVAGNWNYLNYQVDADGSGVYAAWNQRPTLNGRAWISGKIKAKLRYVSNDASVPADQAPATKWNGQNVTGAGVVFAHAVSGSANKPAGRDTLSFSNVNNETETWGIRGTTGNATATRAANGVTLSGTSPAYTVDNSETTVNVTANLPRLTIKFTGDIPRTELNAGLTLRYTLAPAGTANPTERQMALPAFDAQGNVSFSLPVEEAVSQPNKYVFTIIDIDGLYDVKAPTEGYAAFPLTVYRNWVENYPKVITIKAPEVK